MRRSIAGVNELLSLTRRTRDLDCDGAEKDPLARRDRGDIEVNFD